MKAFIPSLKILTGVLVLLVADISSASIANSTSGIKLVRLGFHSNSSETELHSNSSHRNTGIDDDEDSSKEEIARLLDILNTTSLRVSELVLPQNDNETSNNAIKSRFGPKELISLIKIIEGVRKFVDTESNRVSSQQDGSQSDVLGSSLKDIQKFFKENEQKLGAAIKQATSDNSGDSSSISSDSNSSSDSSGDDANSGNGSGSFGSTKFPILGGGSRTAFSRGKNETSKRDGRGGIVNNFMKISSDV